MERVPGYIPAKSPLRSLSPLESAIQDVYSQLKPSRVHAVGICVTDGADESAREELTWSGLLFL